MFLPFNLFLFYCVFMCRSVLPECIYVYSMNAWCPSVIRSKEITVVVADCQPPCVYWKSARVASTFNHSSVPKEQS